MDYQRIRTHSIDFMLNRGWKEKTAKRRIFEQSLFDHTLVELDALVTLLLLLKATFVPPLTEQEEQVLLAGVVAHDVGKELDEWQEYLKDPSHFVSDVNRELAERVVPQLATLLDFTGVEEMLSGVLLHMRHERTPAKTMDRVLFGGHTNTRWKTLADLVDAVDNLCSAKGLFAGLQCLEERSCFSGHVRTAYHLVQMRGVSTTLLHRAAIDSFVAKGWSPLLHYSNGTIYVASATAIADEPTIDEIRARLAENVKNAMGSDFANLVVGKPSGTFLHPDFFDYRHLDTYLYKASERVKRGSFIKKSVETKGRNKGRADTIGEYLRLKGKSVARLNNDALQLHSERIDAAQPEMMIFRFFKESIDPELIGNEVTPEFVESYQAFAGGGGKRKVAKVTPQSVAQAEYDKVFGTGAYDDLKSMSTLMPAPDMALRVDRFWALDGVQFGLDIAQIGNLLDHTKRGEILIDILVDIAGKIYAAIPEEKRPKGATPEQIATSFMADMVHPAPQLNLTELVEKQMQAYAATKANARRAKGVHLCPICNAEFEGGTEAKADFMDKPDAHTNRAVSHGGGGKIVICDACKYEKFLQQLLLGSQVSDVLVLFPRMNIGHGSGEALRQKATRIWDTALNRMSEANPDPDQHLSLGMTFNLARKLSDLDVYRLSSIDIVDLMTYHSRDETAKKHRQDLTNGLKELYAVDELTVVVLNENWGTDYPNVDDALQALIANQVADDDARKVRATAFRLSPQLAIVCQTPHMILVPLTNPISMGNESDTNAGIRELYVTLILGLALDCSVSVMKIGEAITFEGGEGVARVPAVPALRDLIGAEWVAIADAKKWLNAIGAAALLANATAFPERSNLYAILKSPTAGHILRRIEQKSDSGQANIGQIHLLETTKEILK